MVGKRIMPHNCSARGDEERKKERKKILFKPKACVEWDLLSITYCSI